MFYIIHNSRWLDEIKSSICVCGGDADELWKNIFLLFVCLWLFLSFSNSSPTPNAECVSYGSLVHLSVCLFAIISSAFLYLVREQNLCMRGMRRAVPQPSPLRRMTHRVCPSDGHDINSLAAIHTGIFFSNFDIITGLMVYSEVGQTEVCFWLHLHQFYFRIASLCDTGASAVWMRYTSSHQPTAPFEPLTRRRHLARLFLLCFSDTKRQN